MHRLLLLCLVSLAALPGLHAQAVITWDTPQHVSSDTDISTTGTSLWAYNFGGTGAGSVTLNTVSFTAVNYTAVSSNIAFAFASGSMDQTAGNLGSASAPFSTLSSNYKSLLNSAAYFESGSGQTMTLQGLTAGNVYQIQIWNNDSRNALAARSSIYSDGSGNSATLFATAEKIEGGTGYSVLGTFTASGSTEVVYGAAGIDVVVQFNAIQLRDLGASAIPEPSTYAVVAGALALGLAVWRRRKKATAV